MKMYSGHEKRRIKMKKGDKYLKIILTIIAICLVWICIRDIQFTPNKLYASDDSAGQQGVLISGIAPQALSLVEPIDVKVSNEPLQVYITNWKE
jgi:hypothetical protein